MDEEIYRLGHDAQGNCWNYKIWYRTINADEYGGHRTGQIAVHAAPTRDGLHYGPFTTPAFAASEDEAKAQAQRRLANYRKRWTKKHGAQEAR